MPPNNAARGIDAWRTCALWALLQQHALVSLDGIHSTRTDTLLLHSHVTAEGLHLQPGAVLRESRQRGVAHLLQHLCSTGESVVQLAEPRFRGALRAQL